MKILVLGAFGNVGPSVVRELATRHVLRLASRSPVESKHEYIRADVTKPQDMLRAAEGMDAIVSLAVQRPQAQAAFAVNTRGTYNILNAAVELGIRRVVLSGPAILPFRDMGDLMFDFGIDESYPPRPGTWCYVLTKYLGEEVARSFAAAHDITIASIRLVDIARNVLEARAMLHTGIIHERDLARAFRLALEVESLPNRFETFNIVCESPMGRFSMDKARRLLGFEPEFRFEEAWRRSPSRSEND